MRTNDLSGAARIVEGRLAAKPDDLEAHQWRARLWARTGRWSDAESEYRMVLSAAPNDADVLLGLADVLIWQKKPDEALTILDRAEQNRAEKAEVLIRRARIFGSSGRTTEAAACYRELLHINPHDAQATKELRGLYEARKRRYELRIGTDIDTFNYIDAAPAQTVSIGAQIDNRWSALVQNTTYQRFGYTADKVNALVGLHLSQRNWLNIGAGIANSQPVVAEHEYSIEYGHGFRLPIEFVRGIESSFQQRMLWYERSHVLTIGTAQILYLPRGWMWTISATGAKRTFSNTGPEWQPSGYSRMSFPVLERLTGNVGFAVGTEDFANVDEIGRFAARTWSGGLRVQCGDNQDVTGYVAVQDRSQGRSQTSYGVSYGIRF